MSGKQILKKRSARGSICLGTLVWACVVLSADEKTIQPAEIRSTLAGSYFAGGSVVIVPSSHQDIAWMDSPEQCKLDRDRLVITPALQSLHEHPDYRMVMEAAYMLEEYLERHPERKEEIRRLTREGRLEWGATYVQPYESSYSGESLIRGLYFGRRWLKRVLPGCDPVSAWNVDVPARALQFPQILQRAGVKYLVISRHAQGFYRWLSPDGSGVTVWSPGIYDDSDLPIKNKPFAEAAANLASVLRQWEGYFQRRRIPPIYPIMVTTDMAPPQMHYRLIREWNNLGKPLPRIRYASSRELMDAVTRGNPDLPVLVGERPNVWVYIHGPCHHWALSAAREAAILLPAAEKFSTIEALLTGSFARYPAQALSDAWKAQIYPDHGWGGHNGHITDAVFQKKYEFARDEARKHLDAALASIAGQIRTKQAKGRPVAVYNTLSWKRSDPVSISVSGDTTNLGIVDWRGAYVSFQRAVQNGRTEILFVAEDVPPIGYKTYYFVPRSTPPAKPEESAPASEYENRFYRVDFSPGGIRQIHDKELHADLLRTDKFLGGEVFTMRSVGNGAGEFAEVQQPTMEGFDKVSLHAPQWTRVESGPVRAVFALETKIPHVTVRQQVAIYSTLKRIDMDVALLGWDGAQYREFRVALPVNASGARTTYEVPFGVVEVGKDEIPGAAGDRYTQPAKDVRPREVQDWMDVSGASFGVTMSSSVAVFDFRDPTTNPVSYPVLQPLLLASRKSCHPLGNWYLQAGNHEYRFSFSSHRPGWGNGFRFGKQANSPLLAVFPPEGKARGTLPEERSFFSADAPNVIISTIKKSEDDDSVIVRYYEAEGRDTDFQLHAPVAVRKVEVTNILEEEGKLLPVSDGLLRLRAGHHAIESVKLIR